MPLVFSESFEINTILEIFTVFAENLEGNEQLAKAYLMNIAHIKRFELTVSFLLKQEKTLIKDLFQKLYDAESLDENEYKTLKTLYKIQ